MSCSTRIPALLAIIFIVLSTFTVAKLPCDDPSSKRCLSLYEPPPPPEADENGTVYQDENDTYILEWNGSTYVDMAEEVMPWLPQFQGGSGNPLEDIWLPDSVCEQYCGNGRCDDSLSNCLDAISICGFETGFATCHECISCPYDCPTEEEGCPDFIIMPTTSTLAPVTTTSTSTTSSTTTTISPLTPRKYRWYDLEGVRNNLGRALSYDAWRAYISGQELPDPNSLNTEPEVTPQQDGGSWLPTILIVLGIIFVFAIIKYVNKI